MEKSDIFQNAISILISTFYFFCSFFQFLDPNIYGFYFFCGFFQFLDPDIYVLANVSVYVYGFKWFATFSCLAPINFMNLDLTGCPTMQILLH